MKQNFKRFLAVLLTVLLLFSCVPTFALASLLNNDSAQNKEILNALTDVIGSETEAETYYNVMEQYGLLDEDGNLAENWSIEMNGKDVTLDELREMLDGDYDPDAYLWVDGMPVTLDDVKTMLEIEDYITYIRDTYYSDEEWTDEQIESYQSLLKQVQSRGITLQNIGAKGDDGTLIGASGFDHSVRMSFDESINNVDSSLTSYLNKAQSTTLFDEWYVLDGSLCLGGDEDMNLRQDISIRSGLAFGNFDVGKTTAKANALLGTSMARNNNYTYPDYPTKVVPVNGKWSAVCFVTDTKVYANRPDRYRYLYQNGCDRTTIPVYVRESEGNYAGIYPYTDYSAINGYNPDIHYQIIQTVNASEFDSTALKLYAVRGPKEICDSLAANENDPYYFNTYLHYDAHNITFGSGSSVPIVLFFTKPIRPGATIVVNGLTLTNLEECPSTNISFLYPVQDVEDDSKTTLTVSKITATDTNGRTGTWTKGYTINGIHFQTGQHKNIFQGMTAEFKGTVDDPKMHVKVNISSNSALTDWAVQTSMYNPANNDGSRTSKFAKVTVDGKNFTYLRLPANTNLTGGYLEADIPLQKNTSGSTIYPVAELYLEEGTTSEVVYGQAAKIAQPSVVYITNGDITLSYAVKNQDGSNYQFADSTHTIFGQDDPVVKLEYSLTTGKTFTYTNDLVWSSLNPNIAEVDPNGYVTIKGAGDAKFRLTAPNGGFQNAYKDIALKFGTGLTPYLSIPNKNLTSASGKDKTVYWSSNLCEKNGSTQTSFNITLKRGSTTTLTTAVTGTTASPSGSYTIPGNKLNYDFSNNTNNVCTLTVSSVYGGKTYSATATITLEAPTAVVKLNALDSYSILDTVGSLNIGWDITNFSFFSSSNASKLFRLLITKGSETVYDSSNPGTNKGGGHFIGSYTLSNLAVTANSSDKGSFRDVYTVTIQAKNGTDSTWSYDSFLLYVYDADALKLWVDGEDQDSLTMTNVPRISQMTQDEILSLKRDISLKNVISANYGDYAWMEVDDQLAWVSSNNDAATLNYRRATLYDDIRNYSYTSYRPTTEFLLSGFGNGQTTVTARHVLTGMTDSVSVNVETLKDKLYLFQCYPQVQTALTYKTYTISGGKRIEIEKTVQSDNKGAAAIYETNGIIGDVYCRSISKGKTYLGTFYNSKLESGERDSAKLELYPCNNLQLRRAAYAYLYLKNPDGTPYTGKITFRGGVYVNGEYKENAKFALNSSGAINHSGETDYNVSLGRDGKVEVIMDQTQWGLPNNQIAAGDAVSYAFLIKQQNATTYYPIFAGINAAANEDAYVESGDAVVNFRANADPAAGAHPFIIGQYATAKNPAKNYSKTENVLDSKDSIGITDDTPQADLDTVVMWWGETRAAAQNGRVRLLAQTGGELAPKASAQSNVTYRFADEVLTQYTVPMNEESLTGAVDSRTVRGLRMEYYLDGKNLSRKEDLSLRVTNLLHVGKVEESNTLTGHLQRMGMAMGTDAKSDQGFGDRFVNAALELVAGDNFTEGRGGLFKVKISPTSDPTKFLGFVEVNVGGIDDDNPSLETFYEPEHEDLDVSPGLDGLKLLWGCTFGCGATKAITKYSEKMMNTLDNAINNGGYKDWDPLFGVGGYMETLIYFDFKSGNWKMQVLDGGFHAGGGVQYKRVWDFWVGPVPCTTELDIGGFAQVNMDAITAGYLENKNAETVDLDTEFLTQLRINLYLRLFAGVGFDYSVAALKLGIYGKISYDMRCRWLNRPYLSDHQNAYLLSTGEEFDGKKVNLNGQHFAINGEIGLEFIVKVLFVTYQKTLFSQSFNFLNKSTHDWEKIDTLWAANRKSTMKTIETLLNNGSASVTNVGGQRMLALNMAPTMESRAYLADGDRAWNTPSTKKGLFKARARVVEGLSSLETNTYPFANPEISADGELLVYLSDQNSTDVDETRAAFATKVGTGYAQGGIINDGGYGDSQVAVDGTKNLAVATWTRQMQSLNKDEGSVLTDDDQMIMLDSTDIFAAVYNGSTWSTTRLTNDSGADLSPEVAVAGNRAIVAWRDVIAEDADHIAEFNSRNLICYRIFNGSAWGEEKCLYNGTSGEVKGLTCAMMDNGTAAVAYALDTDTEDVSFTDREVIYAVIGTDGNVIRNVRANNDEDVDENPQLAVVSFPSDENGKQRFVLGWRETEERDGQTVSDIYLFDFDDHGITAQLLPECLSQANMDDSVDISSNFRFSKNAKTIDDLSIVWVDREETEAAGAEGEPTSDGIVNTDMSDIAAEKDTLMGVKFYTYGHNQIGLTGKLSIAEMPDATLIDHFDTYTTGGTQIAAAVLGTTYGKDGATQTKTGETSGGDIVTFTVPKAVSALYTATETYEDQIAMNAVSVDYETVKLGAKTQLQFFVRNNGIHAVKQLKLNLAGENTTYDNLNLLPGNTMQIWADYDVPNDRIVNPEYTVTAQLETGNRQSVSGKAYLDLTDLQITDAQIMEEVEGRRVIQIKLNNGNDAALENSGRSVRLSFFSDPSCENEIASLPALTISNDADLKMIDEGGYSIQTTFDVASYVKGDSSEIQEIPDSGISVYIKAEVLTTEEGSTDLTQDAETSFTNNDAIVICDNLKVRTGEDVTLISNFDVQDTTTTVTVNMQNTRLSETTSGNLIVTLLDENGEVLEQQQSYRSGSANNGLLTLGGEAKATKTFTFHTAGADAVVTYSDVVLDYDNVNLTELSFSNIPGISLESFTEQADGTFTASATVDDVTVSSVMAVAESGYSTISVNANGGTAQGGSNAVSETVTLNPASGNTITVTVTSHNGDTKNYVLTLHIRKTITVAADAITKTYGDSDPTLTYVVEGLANGDTLSGALSRAEGETVGTYAISQGSLTADDNYIIDFTGADFSINKKSITVTADAKSKTYGDADPELTYVVTGLVGTDAMQGALTRDIGENYGTYAIKQGTLTAGNNYTIQFTGADFTIGKKVLTIAADAKSKTYGDADPELTYTTQGLKSGDTLSGTLIRTEGENVGAYAITQGDLTAGDNYTIQYTGAEFTIGKKPITVTAESKSKIYGESDPELTYTVEGIKDGDVLTGALSREAGENVGDYEISQGTLDNSNYAIAYIPAILRILVKEEANAEVLLVSDDPIIYDRSEKTPEVIVKDADGNVIPASEYTVTYSGNTNAGTATVTISDNEDGNYAVSGMTTFPILPKPEDEAEVLLVGSAPIVYSGEEQMPAVIVKDETGVEVPASEYTVLYSDNTNAGTATVTITDNEGGNYTISGMTTFTIEKKPITVTADNQVKKCSAADPVLTCRASALITGDAFTGSLIREPGEAVGTYAIMRGTLANDNYSITFVPGVFVIEHNLVKVDAVSPGCTTNGNIVYYRCDGCGALFADADGTTPITAADTVVPAHGHKVSGGTCIYCGKFRCNFCEQYEANKDIPFVGLIYTVIHFFVHLAAHIGYFT